MASDESPTPESNPGTESGPDGSATSRASTAYGRLAERLLAQIVSGELVPGDRLPSEPELSSHFRVSRNTAREALRTLASQGLLTSRRGVGGGVFVSLPNPDELRESLQVSLSLLARHERLSVGDLIEVREVLEVPAAEMAALRRTDDDLVVMRTAIDEGLGESGATRYVRQSSFHTGMIRAAHNPLWELLAEPIFAILGGRFRRDKAAPGVWAQVEREHREILGFLEAGDQAGAREATRAHLRFIHGLWERLEAADPGA